MLKKEQMLLNAANELTVELVRLQKEINDTLRENIELRKQIDDLRSELVKQARGE